MYLCIKSLLKQDLVQQTPGCQNSIRGLKKITDWFSKPCLRLSPLYQIVYEYRKIVTRNPGFLDLNHFIPIISWLWRPPQGPWAVLRFRCNKMSSFLSDVATTWYTDDFGWDLPLLVALLSIERQQSYFQPVRLDSISLFRHKYMYIKYYLGVNFTYKTLPSSQISHLIVILCGVTIAHYTTKKNSLFSFSHY